MTNTEKIIEALVYMEWHLKECISSNEIAAEIGMSTRYFRRLFKQTTGFSVSTYLLKRRLSEALKELVDSPKELVRIAYEYQFTCYNRFVRMFYKQFQVQPYKIYEGQSISKYPVQETIIYDVMRKHSIPRTVELSANELKLYCGI